ncbi:hypothetical protein O1M54_34065 [Streptomyces diastatochromogenes]|nr:hypothetical protein [Streptomyces diastatochromogenes]
MPVAHGHAGATAGPYGQETFTSAAAQPYAGQAAYYPHDAVRVPPQYTAAQAPDAYAGAGAAEYAYDGPGDYAGQDEAHGDAYQAHEEAHGDAYEAHGDARDDAHGDADDTPTSPWAVPPGVSRAAGAAVEPRAAARRRAALPPPTPAVAIARPPRTGAAGVVPS